jgi:hypothetical protein
MEPVRDLIGTLGCVAVFLASSQAAAQARKTNTPTTIAMLTGSCEKLVLAGSDSSSGCDGKLLNTNYRDSRSGFYFVTRDGATLTFSGLGNNQVKPHRDRAVQPIDLIIFGYQGKHDRRKAVGQCDFTNPENRPSRIVCRAITESGVFEAEFVTDGTPPRVTRMTPR